MPSFAKLSKLTARERQYLEAYADNGSYKAVAKVLGVTEKAVDAALTRVREKLGVANTAEALMLLATERASRTIPRATLSNVHRPRKVWLAIAAFCGTLMALIILIGSVERLRASNSIALASSVSPTDTATFDQLVARVKALRDLSSTNLNEIAVAHQRQRLVEEISVRCWTAMWGPTEDYVKTSLVSVAPDIRQTLDWDFAHDPQSAVRILGNCHRILCKVPGFVDWKSLLDKAASVVIDWNAQETGRLFCGIAFAHWNDDAARGFAYAQKAERIFERIPNADWDKANALRHMGLCWLLHDSKNCAPNWDLSMKLYDRALDIYKKLGDKRGVAMILLSKAEAGRPPGRVFDNELTAVEAAESFRELGNRDLFGEAVGQARSEEWQEPCTVQYTQRRRRIRSLYLSVAADQRQRTDWPAWQTTMAECIGVDLRIADQSLALADLHAILADLQTSDDNLKGELFGCYVAECGMRHETVDAAIQRDYAGLLNSTSFRHGRHSTLREVARCLVAAGDADRI